jgi:hypothetical protein
MSRVPREAWYATTPQSDGTFALAPWMLISCVTPSRTIQTSAQTIRGLFGSHAPRARNVGTGWGLSVEEARTILGPTGAVFGPGVTAVGAPTIVDPAGTYMAAQIDYDGSDAPGSDHIAATYVTPSVLNERYVTSAWERTPSQPFVIQGQLEPSAPLLATERAPWALFTTGAVGDGATPLVAHLASPPATNLPFTLYSAFSQVEQGGVFPTSFLATGAGVRDADILRIDPTLALVNGFYDLSLLLAPNWGSLEKPGQSVLYYFDVANFVYYDAADQMMYLRSNGGNFGVGPLVWSRNQEIRVSVRATANGRRVSVEGATSGNGEVVIPAAAIPIAVPGGAFCLGDGTVSISADLRAIEFFQPGG